MSDTLVRALFYVWVCAAAGFAQGAARATTPAGILRHGLRSTVSLGGGIALLCAAIWLLMRVTQG
ncbi:MAG: hypothetical protein K8T90_15450 [Planctomycetes bacterium]|nr:hypothetical protein [Planctomycetota bacterium]